MTVTTIPEIVEPDLHSLTTSYYPITVAIFPEIVEPGIYSSTTS